MLYDPLKPMQQKHSDTPTFGCVISLVLAAALGWAILSSSCGIWLYRFLHGPAPSEPHRIEIDSNR